MEVPQISELTNHEHLRLWPQDLPGRLELLDLGSCTTLNEASLLPVTTCLQGLNVWKVRWTQLAHG